jgi:DNA-binding winged helix-turn-helix (wHTH) protein/Tol biopolymer transport system component
MAASTTSRSYRFGDFQLDTARRILKRDGAPVALTPKAFDTLVVLVTRGGQVVEKEELLKEVWPDSFVEEATLAQNIFTLRKVLGQNKESQQYIETVPKHGYRFGVDVTELPQAQTVLFEKVTRTHIVTEECSEDSSFDEAGHPTPQPISGVLTSRSLTHKSTLRRNLVTGFIAACILVGSALLLMRALRTSKFGRLENSTKPPRITRLTSSGRITSASISSDGKYIAYAETDGQRDSLWIRQVSAASAIQLVSPAQTQYGAISFSPENTFLYYVGFDDNNPVGILYEVPVLGGVARKVLEDVDSNITFSPDHNQIAFIRYKPQAAESRLVIARIDGSEQREAAKRLSPGSFAGSGPAWSPDGKSIVCALRTGDPNRTNQTVVSIEVETGKERILTEHRWDTIGQVAWLSDGHALIIDAWDSTTTAVSRQVWEVLYPAGQARMITNDMNSYQNVSVTSDSKTISEVLSDRVAHMWIFSPKSGVATQITSGTGDKNGAMMGISWTTSDHIVYGSTAGDHVAVWAMQSDGTNQTQLTPDESVNFKPTAGPDGSIVFVSRRTGSPEVWQMDAKGNNPKQLTSHLNGTYPAVSPDGKTVVFASIDERQMSLWKISIDGGSPVQLTEKNVVWPTFSPNGKLIAAYYRDNPQSFFKIGVFPISGGGPIKTFDIPREVFFPGGVRWSPDGRSITYIKTEHDVSNIWSQPLNGGPPKQFTNFTSDQIFRFAWSPNGTELVLERGFNIADVVVINNPMGRDEE